MKKSTMLSPRDISKKRLARSKLSKINTSDLNLANKENIKPQVTFVSKFKLKTHDRETEDFGRKNPFNIPDRQRVFSKSKAKIKVKVRKIKPEPFIMSEPQTICDVDSTFYKIIEGRPLRQFDDIKVYIRNIRDITLLKANAAYLKDQIIQSDTVMALELKKYTNVKKLFTSCKQNFVQFATQSYNNSKAIQDKAKEVEKELEKVTDELEALCFEYVALRNQLGVLIVNFQTLSRYRNFLHMLSPEEWKIENEQIYVSFSFNFDETTAFEEPIDEYKCRLNRIKEVPLKLYFKRPKALVSVFDNISYQCLTYMGINGRMSNIITSVIKHRDYLKAQVTEEINEMQDLIEVFKSNIKFEEEKEQMTKAKFEKILINDFQTLYASYDATKLFTCLQFTNTQVFHGPEDPKDNMVSLMLSLESHYFELTSALDNLDQVIVKQATKEFLSEDLKMMKNAYKAQRILKESLILRKALVTSFEPPHRRHKQK